MKSLSLKPFKCSLLCLPVFILISCAPKMAPQGPMSVSSLDPKLIHMESPENGPTPFGLSGTTDSGGGTGLMENDLAKMFEHFMIDPTQQPAYIKHIEPFIKGLKQNDTEPKQNIDVFFRLKNWYIAPVDFDKVSKDSLGISFIKTSTVQIARHTKRSIWINKKLYEDLGKPESGSIEQAEVLIHEWVMGLYFLKFTSAADLCPISKESQRKKDCIKNADLLEKKYPTEPPRPLNEIDNERIRTVTAWILQNKSKENRIEDFYRILLENEFDPRFFDPLSSEKVKAKNAEIVIEQNEFYLSIEATQRSTSHPNLCRGLDSNKALPCKIQIQPAVVTLHSGKQKIESPGLEIKIDIEGKSKTFQFGIGNEIRLSGSEYGPSGIIYQTLVVEHANQPEPGRVLHYASLWFRKENDGPHSALHLETIVVRSAEIVSKDLKRDPICLVRTPGVREVLDDQFLIQNDRAQLNISAEFFLKTPPMGLCFN